MSTITLPSNLDAEVAVLGAILLANQELDTALSLGLTAEQFFRDAHRRVYRAITALAERKSALDLVTVKTELERTGDLDEVGVGYLANLVREGVRSTNLPHYIGLIQDTAMRRAVMQHCGAMLARASAGEEAAPAVLDAAVQGLLDISGRSQVGQLVEGPVLVGEAIAYLEELTRRRADRRVAGVSTGFLDLDQMTDGFHPGQLVIVAARPSQGKALALDTPIPTTDGWVPMGAITVGQRVFDESGRVCRVTAVSPIYLGDRCYEVTFSDGTRVVADADHQWFAYNHSAWKSFRERHYRRNGGYSATSGENVKYASSQEGRIRHPRVVTTRQMLDEGVQRLGRANWMIPVAAPLDLPHVDLPVDPYVLGCWLGDGNTASARMTIGDQDVAHFVEAFASAGYRLSPEKTRYSYSTTPVRGAGRWQSYSGPVRHLASELTSLGLTRGKKFIPSVYLRASLPQRLALLQGLMDTDGHASPKAGCVELVLMDRALLSQVRELICSLGQRPRQIHKKPVTLPDGRVLMSYRLAWTPRDIVFRMSRKAQDQPCAKVQRFFGKTAMRAVRSIREVPSVAVRCISVDSPSRLYLATESMVPTHNSAIALQFALASESCAFFSLEMTRMELAIRELAVLGRVDGWAMRKGYLSSGESVRVSRALDALAESGVAIDDTPAISVAQLRAKARRRQVTRGLALIVVDYVQLMTAAVGKGRKDINREQEVASVARGLKAAAKELQVPVVALAQLNRATEQGREKEPTLANLRESGALEQDADVVMFVHRPDGQSVAKEGDVHLIVAKNRTGPIGTVPLRWYPSQTRFGERDEVSEPRQGAFA